MSHFLDLFRMKMPVTQSDTPILSAWETSMIDVFVRAAGLIGLPRSIGEIYGLLFCTPKALSFDELVERFELSFELCGRVYHHRIIREHGLLKLAQTCG